MAGREKSQTSSTGAGTWCKFELVFLFKKHPKAAQLSDLELLDYARLWGFSVELRRITLPYPYIFSNDGLRLLAKNVGSPVRRFTNSMQKCREIAIIDVDTDGDISVVGVDVIHTNFEFKDGVKRSKKPADKSIREESIPKERRKRKPAKVKFECPTKYLPIFARIRNVPLSAFANVEADQNWIDNITKAEAAFADLGVSDPINRLCIEIGKCETFILGKIDSGDYKKGHRHVPRTRLTNWWRKAWEIERDNMQRRSDHANHARVYEPHPMERTYSDAKGRSSLSTVSDVLKEAQIQSPKE